MDGNLARFAALASEMGYRALGLGSGPEKVLRTTVGSGPPGHSGRRQGTVVLLAQPDHDARLVKIDGVESLHLLKQPSEC